MIHCCFKPNWPCTVPSHISSWVFFPWWLWWLQNESTTQGVLIVFPHDCKWLTAALNPLQLTDCCHFCDILCCHYFQTEDIFVTYRAVITFIQRTFFSWHTVLPLVLYRGHFCDIPWSISFTERTFLWHTVLPLVSYREYFCDIPCCHHFHTEDIFVTYHAAITLI